MIIPGLVTAIYSETIAGSAVVRAFGAHSVMVNGTHFQMSSSIQRDLTLMVQTYCKPSTCANVPTLGDSTLASGYSVSTGIRTDLPAKR